LSSLKPGLSAGLSQAMDRGAMLSDIFVSP
jgi:hypothetical protein